MNNKIKISLYWKCQLIGWSSAAAYWALNAYVNGSFNVWLGLAFFVLDIVIGIAVTHAYRQFAHKNDWTRLDLAQLPWRITSATILTGLAYMLLVMAKNYYVRESFGYHIENSFSEYLRVNFLTVTATGVRLMAIWILAFHLYHYALMQINTTRENARLTLIAKESQLNNLSAQLNPHFFFNSLNTVKALVATDPDKARRAIDLLSDLLRTSLYKQDNLLISLTEELGLVNDYFELEKMRFEDRIMYNIDVDESITSHFLLPLSIQTLAENAIKHGIARYMDGGSIDIKVEMVEDSIRISVQNPGRIDTSDLKGGLGLKNLEERLMLQYGNRASLKITQSESDTVSSVIIIPAS